jgi:hypothetical protein
VKKYLIAGGISLVSLAVGTLAGYQLAVRRLESRYAEMMEREIAETRKHYGAKLLNAQNVFSTPEEAAAALLPTEIKGKEFPDEVPTPVLEKILEGLRYHTPSTAVATIKTNVFTNDVTPAEGDDFMAEIEARDPEKPYIISHIEHLQNEMDYSQVTVTYYEGDNVVADSRDDVIEDHGEVIGQDNIRFGHRSHDPNVVFVRNDRLGIDYEILRSTGKYSEEVLDLR